MKTSLFALIASALLLAAIPAKADVLTLGTLTNYSLVDLGTGDTISINSGPGGGHWPPPLAREPVRCQPNRAMFPRPSMPAASERFLSSSL